MNDVDNVTILSCSVCSEPLVLGSDANMYCPNRCDVWPLHVVIERLTEGTIRHENEEIH